MLPLHITFLCIALCGIFFGTADSSQEENDFVIASYFPDYRSYLDVNKSAKFMTDLILFSISPNPSGKITESTCCLGEDHYKKAREARSFVNPDLRIFVSIGGGGRSESLAELLSTEDGRDRFVKELIDLCRNEELNGIDLDWEGYATREEYISYVLLIRTLSQELHQEGLLLSIAIHAQQFFPTEVYQNVDRVNLMAYDMITSKGGHHASFENVQKAVDKLIQSGCDSTKIVLGLPAYGRHKDSPQKVKTYSEIIENMNTKALPEEAELFAKNKYMGYMFDSPAMIKDKVKLAFAKKLQGVFLWELGQDFFDDEQYTGGMLIQSASSAVQEIKTSGAKTTVESSQMSRTKLMNEL